MSRDAGTICDRCAETIRDSALTLRYFQCIEAAADHDCDTLYFGSKIQILMPPRKARPGMGTPGISS